MGVELLDIQFRIERRFGILLSADQMLSFTTVGDIADVIASRASATRRAQCVMLPAFLETRRFVRDFVNDANRPIRPAASITSVIPRRELKAFWAAMGEWCDLPPPWLRLSTTYRLVFVALMLAVAYLAIFDGWYGIAAACFVIVAMVAVKGRLPHVPPKGFTTFWDVAKRRATMNGSIAKDINEVDLFTALQHELSGALGVETSEIQLGTRLKEDLGVG